MAHTAVIKRFSRKRVVEKLGLSWASVQSMNFGPDGDLYVLYEP